MYILIIKTGVELYSNKIYTSTLYLSPTKMGQESMLLTEHSSYMPHEEIICGLNGCFGRWEIGHVTLPPGAKIFSTATRKIIAYDPHQSGITHKMYNAIFEIPGHKECRYTKNYWGYNGGGEISVLLSGKFHLVDEKTETYKIGTSLSSLPF